MSRSPSASPSRRRFLRGKGSPAASPPVFRPPWTSEQSVTDHCTACHACIDACETSVITVDPDGLPHVVFDLGECTFCAACAQACPEPVFNTQQVRPWSLGILINDSCLLQAGVTCQLCTDQCDAQALRLDLRVRPSGKIRIDLQSCTGCGACIAPCPSSAIEMINPQLSQPPSRKADQ